MQDRAWLGGGAAAGNPFDDVATEEQAVPAEATSSVFMVRVVAGPAAGVLARIDTTSPAPALIGSSQVCALRLEDPGVSRRHAALELASGGLRLRDLGSTNGTRIQGVRVVEALLDGGELVTMGSSVLAIERERSVSPPALPNATRFGRLFGASAAMRRLYPLFERLARTSIPVIIEGETGTGKEALAQALHEASPRADQPFVVFDCAATAPNLLESELFGHERGAVPGATAARAGLFQQAHGGTLLIDEIGELDLALQPKLLRAIERSEVRPLGGQDWTKVDVRVLVATRRDLDREVSEGRFRDDLFHRLAVARVELPPLRARGGDIEALARAFWLEFLAESCGEERPAPEPPADLVRRWAREPWPGNVRQLRNAVARAVALGDVGAEPTAADSVPAGDLVDRAIGARLPLAVARERVVHEFERRYLEAVLARHDGKVSRAAAESGVALRYFQLLRQRRAGQR